MREPESTPETALYGTGWDEPLPAVIYQDEPTRAEILDGMPSIKADQKRIKESLKIDEPGKANRAIRRIKEARRQEIEIGTRAQADLDRIEGWRDKEQKRKRREIELFESLLRDYAHGLLSANDWKDKNLSLSEGTLKFRKRGPKLLYDNEQLMDELEAEGVTDLVRYKREPDLNRIKEALKEGLEIKSITVIEQDDSFTVSIN